LLVVGGINAEEDLLIIDLDRCGPSPLSVFVMMVGGRNCGHFAPFQTIIHAQTGRRDPEGGRHQHMVKVNQK
jgi:hypothetical protein